MTDNPSIIYTLLTAKVTNGFESIKQEDTISAPKKSEPVSPIKILAGLILKNKKPSVPPMTAAETKALSATSEHEI